MAYLVIKAILIVSNDW